MIIDDDPAALVREWGIDCTLATRLVLAAQLFRIDTGHELEIFSGYRSEKKQLELARAGRPAAPVDLSTHTSCPATGADIRPVGVFPARVFQIKMGGAVQRAGLRWGGGSEFVDGIPTDWRHVDLGPRNREL